MDAKSIVNTRTRGTGLKSIIEEMVWNIKLEGKEIALQKLKQENKKMNYDLKEKMKGTEAALASETETTVRLEKQMVEEREAWKKYCEDLEKQLGEK